MKGETTYNKYKRENKIMKAILSADAKNFLLEAYDYEDRVTYLKNCILTYRHNKLREAI